MNNACRSIVVAVLSLILLAPAAGARPDPDDIKQWGQWRGPNRDGITTEKDLFKKWPDGTMPVERCTKEK